MSALSLFQSLFKMYSFFPTKDSPRQSSLIQFTTAFWVVQQLGFLWARWVTWHVQIPAIFRVTQLHVNRAKESKCMNKQELGNQQYLCSLNWPFHLLYNIPNNGRPSNWILSLFPVVLVESKLSNGPNNTWSQRDLVANYMATKGVYSWYSGRHRRGPF